MIIKRHVVERFIDRHDRTMEPNAAYAILRRICLTAERLPGLTRTGEARWLTSDPAFILITKSDPSCGLVAVTGLGADEGGDVDEASCDEVLEAYRRATAEMEPKATDRDDAKPEPETFPDERLDSTASQKSCTCTKATRRREEREKLKLSTEAAQARAAARETILAIEREKTAQNQIQSQLQTDEHLRRDKERLLSALNVAIRFLVRRRSDPEVATLLTQIEGEVPGFSTDKFLASWTKRHQHSTEAA